MFLSSTLLALCLVVPEADAASTGNGILLIIGSNDILFKATDGATAIYGVTAEVESDAGSEEVTLIESDTSLHGSAAIAALPGTDSRITLTLYDTASASLISFSGTLGADGSVSVTADADECDGSGKTLCSPVPDIEVLASELFVAAAGGYDVAFDLNGADAYDVAYADLVITESKEVTTCEKGGACTTTGSTTTTEAEVDWDTIAAVWEGELSLAHEGVIEIKSTSLDSGGKKIESAKTKLGAPWIDSGSGINALATDEDPLTSVAWRTVDGDGNQDMITVVSTGWTSTTTPPVTASIALTSGTTLTIPVNSYQRVADRSVVLDREALAAATTVEFWTDGSSTSFNVGDGVTTGYVECDMKHNPIVCWIVDEDFTLDVTTSSPSPVAPTGTLDVSVIYLDAAGGEIASQSEVLGYSEQFGAVFAEKVSYAADPIGTDLSGKVSLFGAANSKGKQSTLSSGTFYGTLNRDADGDMSLAGADKDKVTKTGSAVSYGDAVTNLPAVVLSSSNGGDTLEKHGDILIDGVKIDYD